MTVSSNSTIAEPQNKLLAAAKTLLIIHIQRWLGNTAPTAAAAAIYRRRRTVTTSVAKRCWLTGDAAGAFKVPQ